MELFDRSGQGTSDQSEADKTDTSHWRLSSLQDTSARQCVEIDNLYILLYKDTVMQAVFGCMRKVDVVQAVYGCTRHA
jgi:hypothetical protein